ncbi:hypothetical protein FGG08_007032 [Glutinoglossum americanum]|uniref:Uncharacterized protein n=1 Tax=Glutinoglossum americanum TaxID=1670608 RepID=A0A9P8I296_9PEZI|nr:hypothetical protein FGG08_007032 [Glutinoglossum americanum]
MQEFVLKISVQANGSEGHDCPEDALAAREVVLWCIRNPGVLELWGEAAREVEIEKGEARKKKMEKGRGGKEAQARKEGRTGNNNTRTEGLKSGKSHSEETTPLGGDGSNNLDDSDEPFEVPRWKDMAEDCGRPHPDTGYDPWPD